MIKKCLRCDEDKEHHGKGLCYSCYKKYRWIPEIAQKKPCKRCKNIRIIHTKGLCKACYNFIFHMNRIKEFNSLKSFGLKLEKYNELTKKCVVCGFDNLVDLHHLDENHSNNNLSNLIPLCPNHHKMVHNSRFRSEMRDLLKEKGFFLKEDPKLDFVLEA